MWYLSDQFFIFFIIIKCRIIISEADDGREGNVANLVSFYLLFLIRQRLFIPKVSASISKFANYKFNISKVYHHIGHLTSHQEQCRTACTKFILQKIISWLIFFSLYNLSQIYNCCYFYYFCQVIITIVGIVVLIIITKIIVVSVEKEQDGQTFNVAC